MDGLSSEPEVKPKKRAPMAKAKDAVAKPPKPVKAKAPKELKPKASPKPVKVPKKKAPSRAKSSGGFRRSRGFRRGGGYVVTHSCGCEQGHKLPAQKWKRERDIERLKTRPCTACWATAEAEASEKGLGVVFPKLKGTQAQVLWARSIRAKVIDRLIGDGIILDRIRRERGLCPGSIKLLEMAMHKALAPLSAKWWIENSETFTGRVGYHFMDLDEIQIVEALYEELGNECPF